jgi:hypothetical protein
MKYLCFRGGAYKSRFHGLRQNSNFTFNLAGF